VIVHQAHVLEPVETSGDARLVRDDRDRDARLVEPGDGLRRASNELDPVHRADVAGIDDDRPVAVKQYPRTWGFGIPGARTLAIGGR
jgi:hypothetical protein